MFYKHILNLVCLQLQCFVPGISGHQHLEFYCQPPHVLGECSCGSLTNLACYRGGRGSGVIGYHWMSLVFQMSICQECFIDILSLQARMEVLYYKLVSICFNLFKPYCI